MHHIVVFVLPKGELLNPDAPGAALCGTAPGDMPLQSEDGLAKKIPAGAGCSSRCTTRPTARPYRDRSSVGLIFAKEKPQRHRMLTKPIYNRRLHPAPRSRSPPATDNYKIEARFHVFVEDGRIVALMPHMHLRGKDFRYEAIYPDGKRKCCCRCRATTSTGRAFTVLPSRRGMPKGTSSTASATSTTRRKIRNNPDPKKDVFWGDQTWEEMMVGWMDYCYETERK